MTFLIFNSPEAIFWVMTNNCHNHFVWQRNLISSPYTEPLLLTAKGFMDLRE
jgi:hypothetical protein